MRTITIRAAIVTLTAIFCASSAAALDLIPIINSITNAAGDAVIDPSGESATATLATGDQIVVSVVVSNANADALQAIFATLSFDSTQLQVNGAGYSPILVEGDCGFICTPPSLGTSTNPAIKANTPAGDIKWYQALAHSNVSGAAGTGPDTGIQILFEVVSNTGTDEITLPMGLTSGDAISIPEPSGAPFEGELIFGTAMINAPEPGAAALALASLGTVVLIGRLRRR